MSKIEIDFNSLKYNLYELLSVKKNEDSHQIKKKFQKIIKKHHPDRDDDNSTNKNKDDIYHHLILANQILLNPESRAKYDEFLENTAETFYELKSSFNKNQQSVKQFFPEESASKSLFNSKLSELNKKHGYDDSTNAESIMDKFNRVKESRNSNDITIEKEDIKDSKDFNQKFDFDKSL